MTINDFRSIEFGICTLAEGEQGVFRIPIDDSVRNVLVEMYDTFYELYNADNNDAVVFEPSEKYGNTEKLTIDYNSEHLAALRDLFDQRNIPITDVSINQIAKKVVFYFAVFRRRNNTKYIAIKRPSQFKGLLEKKLIYFVDDTLKAVEDNIFKLDNDFDFIIHGQEIDILHPMGFIFIAEIEAAILATAAHATRQLARQIRFVDFNYLANFVGTSKTAAKLVASIKSRDDLSRTSQDKLREKCIQLGVQLREDNGKIIPEDQHIIRFLQILDRREYDVDLTDEEREIYVASSRKRLN